MHAVGSLQANLAQFMRAAGLSEVVIEVQCVGARAVARAPTQQPGSPWEQNTVPGGLVEESVRLRAPMARPGGGAWTWASLSTSSRDYELVSDLDYDRQPRLNPPLTKEDCAEELRLLPRDPRATPAWMAQG